MNNKFLSSLLLASGLLYAAVVFSIFPKWTVDDAYITFRYAANLADHGQFVWNVGENPVEGYTGVFWPAFLAGFIKLGFSPITVSHVVGIVAFFAGWILLFLILRLLKAGNLATGLTLLFYSTSQILFTHALSGLETFLFIDAILLSFYFLISSRDSFLFLSLLLTSLVRPEGVALAAAVLTVGGFLKFKYDNDKFRPWVLKFVIWYLAPAAIYFIWRANYYGALLPNTYYAKSGGFSLNNLIDISRFLRRWFAVPLLAGAMLLAAEADWLWSEIKIGRRKLLDVGFLTAFWSACLFAALLIFALWKTHLLTNFSTRFYTPLMPLFWIGLGYLFGLGLSALGEFKNKKPLGFKLLLAIFFALTFYQILFQAAKLKEEMAFVREQIAIHESEHNVLGQELKGAVRDSEWLVVYIDAGAIPYFSELKSVDFGGLNDSYLARQKLTQEERINYFFSKNPGALVFTSLDEERVSYGKEAETIMRDPRFKNYTLYKKYLSPLPRLDYHQFVYLRKDIILDIIR